MKKKLVNQNEDTENERERMVDRGTEVERQKECARGRGKWSDSTNKSQPEVSKRVSASMMRLTESSHLHNEKR